jgi:hypothetical protein
MSTNISLEELLGIKTNIKFMLVAPGSIGFSKFLLYGRGGIGFGSNFGQTRERYFE